MTKKILVIDDEELLTRTLTLLLERKGYEVLAVKNGQEAEAICEEEEFDLIIADIRMPGMNGIETVKSIRRRKNGKDIPVIFISGYVDDSLEKEIESFHPFGYFRKPFDNDCLISKIETLIK